MRKSLPGWPLLSGGGREGLGWPNSLAAFDLRGLMLVSVRLEGLMDTGSCRNNKIDVFLRWKSHICVHFRCFIREKILIIVFTNTIISFLILLTIKFGRKDDGAYDDDLYRS